MNLTQAIKAQAAKLGFSLSGVTTPDPLPHAEVFESWLEQGRQGEMSYLSAPRSRLCRAQPRHILPGCRSVLVLAARYPTPLAVEQAEIDATHPRGRVASYAWGEDYHHSLPEQLDKLVGFIESQLGHSFASRIYTDTGPILERELAQRAGLGWIGKNTCLINPHQGSYFLLSEIFLSIELEPDSPFSADRCGTCHRCIDACPTGCILPDRTLDARRCISYLTIELKGSIPPGLRSLVGRWVFGCDVCQLVCPWNRFAGDDAADLFGPRLLEPQPNLLEELALGAEDFNRKYRRSPLSRAKRRGYLRNITVALGNLRRPDAVPVLAELLEHEDEPLLRLHTAWALGQVGSPAARYALKKAFLSETDAVVKAEIRAAQESH